MGFLKDIGVQRPIVQAPMAGISTPELAAAVSNASGLGSIGIGAAQTSSAREMIEAVRALTDRPFNVNLFVHATPVVDALREQQWLKALAPVFEAFGAHPPEALNTIYRSFADDDEMFKLLLALRPPVISFHFGLPSQDKIAALKAAECTLLSTATNLDEARAAEQAGVDAIVAQGYEAGGHRGMFDPSLPDQKLGTFALTQLLVAKCSIPVIAAGGIMDGRGIASMIALGAEAAQLGTAFVACPESKADAAYREALRSDGAFHTVMTTAISGRPARCLVNRFTAWASEVDAFPPPDYPRAYDAGKALHAAAKAQDEFGFGAQWAGQGAPLIRAMPAAELVETLMRELQDAFRAR
ncbi:MAG: NAD(P)H-dependent flavin oxidoreductase [Henriciella sp.]